MIVKEFITKSGLSAVVALKGHILNFYCGYVAVERGHPLFGMCEDDVNDLVSVHGGVTFSGGSEASSVQSDESRWWFGFYCMLGTNSMGLKDEQFVIAECESFARQLAKLSSRKKKVYARCNCGNTLIKMHEKASGRCELCIDSQSAIETSRAYEKLFNRMFPETKPLMYSDFINTWRQNDRSHA